MHRLLDRREWKGRPEVHKAIDSEKNGLLEGGTWLGFESIAKADVLKRYSGSTVKAGVVFRGDAVRDPDGLAATFQELQASAPRSIAGLNIVMAYSMIGDLATTLAPLPIASRLTSSVC